MGYSANFAFSVALQGRQRTAWAVTPHRRGDNHFSLCTSSSSHWLCVLTDKKPLSMNSPGSYTPVLSEIQQTLSRHHWPETIVFGHGASSQPATPVPLRTICFKEKMALLVLWRLWTDSCPGLVPAQKGKHYVKRK